MAKRGNNLTASIKEWVRERERKRVPVEPKMRRE
jgi:hypothetical protein